MSGRGSGIHVGVQDDKTTISGRSAAINGSITFEVMHQFMHAWIIDCNFISVLPEKRPVMDKVSYLQWWSLQILFLSISYQRRLVVQMVTHEGTTPTIKAIGDIINKD